MKSEQLISWLLEGDVSIRYQTYKDLLDEDRPEIKAKIASEGWGACFLSKRNKYGHWGQRFYQPKWTSSHYTLLDLRHLYLPQDNPVVKETIRLILEEEKLADGGIGPGRSIQNSDVCVNGMFINYATYFGADEKPLESIIDFILSQYMPDGGFNCRSNRDKPVHSSLHTTLSVLEGITTYEMNGYRYRLDDLRKVKATSVEFILMHQLFLSDRTGEIIHKDFLRLSYPGRWRYDILRALDYFQFSNTSWDDRMQVAIDVLMKKRNIDGTWNLQAKIPGQEHFEMEKAGNPSRWNTLRAMRVLKHFELLDQVYRKRPVGLVR